MATKLGTEQIAEAQKEHKELHLGEPLQPPYERWEKRTTKEGKTYFANHDLKLTQWQHPSQTPSQQAALQTKKRDFGPGKDLSDEEMNKLKFVFEYFDEDKSGFIDEKELSAVFKKLGQNKSEGDIKAMIGDVDQNSDGVISWDEFVDMMKRKYAEPVKPGSDTTGTSLYASSAAMESLVQQASLANAVLAAQEQLTS